MCLDVPTGQTRSARRGHERQSVVLDQSVENKGTLQVGGLSGDHPCWTFGLPALAAFVVW